MQNLSLLTLQPDPLPSFAQASTDLGPLLQPLYEALEAGAMVCRQVYGEHFDGERPAPHLREMLVRAKAKQQLAKRGLQVQELKERRTHLATEPLISLLIHHDGYAVRVLKGRGGVPPGCGTSKKRRSFYNQRSVHYLDEQGVCVSSRTNLLALWDFDLTFGISGLWLACPEVAGTLSHQVILGWKEEIPHPALRMAGSLNGDLLDADKEASEELEDMLLGTDKAHDESQANWYNDDEEAPAGEETEVPC